MGCCDRGEILQLGLLRSDPWLVDSEAVINAWLEDNWKDIFSSNIMPEPEPGCPG